jgi:nucleotide-binding universal stress UspA family protein
VSSPADALCPIGDDVGARPTIVVGIDGTDESQRALAYAIGVARRNGGRIVCAFVADPSPAALGLGPQLGGIAYGLIDQAAQAAEVEIASLVARAGAAAPDVTVEMRQLHGEPAHTLARFADEVMADQVIIGAPRHPKGHVFSSVSRSLHRRPRWPITIVP